MPKLYKK